MSTDYFLSNDNDGDINDINFGDDINCVFMTDACEGLYGQQALCA